MMPHIIVAMRVRTLDGACSRRDTGFGRQRTPGSYWLGVAMAGLLFRLDILSLRSQPEPEEAQAPAPPGWCRDTSPLTSTNEHEHYNTRANNAAIYY